MLTTILIAVLSFIVLASLGYVLTSDGNGSQVAVKRAQAIASADPSRAKRQKSQNRTPEERRKQIMLQLKESERQERKARLTLTARMTHAGITPNLTRFWIISGILGVVFAIGVFLLKPNALVALGAGFAAGYGLPRWVLGFMAGGRQKKFTRDFPDALDILTRGIKSGLPIHDSIKVIAREGAAPLGPEFQRLVDNIGGGRTIIEALDIMYDRIPTAELKFFTIVLAIQQKTGGNLAEALNNLSTVLRARKMMREKVKALSSEAIASASIIGSLPPGVAIMIFLSRPDYIRVMFTDPRGQMMLAAGLVWMLLGILSMRKMINFKM
ncbi:type II secretion system F family protein [Asticcacaulis endophyticus]|uniref:Secretion protein F n=1 Tax=Asticcacaulis endophyticus TaxID=1395890 RepID=A0A918PSQ6_9CAUL|nr:type II secretion system F family protein [Asticcacaulis endophyticus]GGZ20679.1 secretion protein F [Asticcacaulis endophyticus]